MKRLRYLLLALLLGCLVPGLSAAPADVPRGTTPAPLRSLDGRAVFNVAKDADGYVWMVTRTGASRFDGRSVRYYPLVGSELLTDGDGHQTALRIDREGRLWVFTDSGKLFCYNPWSDSFEQRLNLPDYDSGVLLNDIFFDAAGGCGSARPRGFSKPTPGPSRPTGNIPPSVWQDTTSTASCPSPTTIWPSGRMRAFSCCRAAHPFPTVSAYWRSTT